MYKRLLSLVLLLPISAYANVGIPVVSFGLPFMIANLLFVVLIEAFVLNRISPTLEKYSLIKQIFLANLITTLIGYPAVAIFEAMGAIFGLNLGWLLPFQNLGEMKVYIGTAMLLTLIPCYFLSVWVEGRWLKRRLSVSISWKHMFIAHLASYAFLTAQVYSQFPVHPLTYGRYTFEPFFVFIMSIAQFFAGGT